MSPSEKPAAAPGESLGPLLIHLRNDRGLVQKEAARRAGIDASTLSRLEKNERGVSREVLDRICQVLSLDRKQKLAVLVAAGFLTSDDARVLADEDVAALAIMLGDPGLPERERQILRTFVSLALEYATARGLTVNGPTEAAE